MATPKKLKNGKWRVMVYLGKDETGKPRYTSVTEDTKAECIYSAAKLSMKGYAAPKPVVTLSDAIGRYIADSSFLSPTTTAGYEKIQRTMFQDLMQTDIEDLTDAVLQKAINAESERISRRGTKVSPKSVRNAYGLISASVKHINGMTYTVRLPDDEPKFIELPEPEDVYKAVKGTDIELPCLLAMWLSLSMSEIRGLKYSSIRNGCLYIDQVVVDVDGTPVEKARAKVKTRNRVLALPGYIESLICSRTGYNDYLAGKIPDDYLLPFKEYQIRRKLNRLVPGISFHQLRHMNASVMLKLGIPDKYAMERGGWATPHTMKTVYQHTFSKERRKVDEKIDDFFEKLLEGK